MAARVGIGEKEAGWRRQELSKCRSARARARAMGPSTHFTTIRCKRSALSMLSLVSVPLVPVITLR